LTAGIPGIFGKIIRNKKFIFEVRDLWPELPREMGVIKNPILLMLMDELEYLSYKYADKCIALAPGILEGIKKKAPLKQIALIPNGCDHLEVESVTKKKNKFIAVFTGAHGIANGLHAILDMANYLLEIGVDDIEIHFIGDGKEKDGLVERSKREKLRNCRFFDPMPKKVLFKYLMENADVGLMVLENIPAFYNGTSPNKFFDYLAVGIPVVNNYPGWIAEIIKKNDCGIPVPPGNPKKFAEAIISLRDNRVLYEKMKKNSFNLSISDFDRQKLAIKFVKYLTK